MQCNEYFWLIHLIMFMYLYKHDLSFKKCACILSTACTTTCSIQPWVLDKWNLNQSKINHNYLKMPSSFIKRWVFTVQFYRFELLAKMNCVVCFIMVSVLVSTMDSKSVHPRGTMTSLEKECWEHCNKEYHNCKLFYGCRKLPSGDFNKECPFDCVKWSETCIERCL